MMDIKRVGIDLAKNVFHLTAVDEADEIVGAQAPASSGAAILPDVVAARLRGRYGSLWQRASLGAVCDAFGSPGDDDEPAQGGALHASQQERRQRRRRDHRGIGPARHALCWGEVGGPTTSPAIASGAAVGGAGSHGAREPIARFLVGIRNRVPQRNPSVEPAVGGYPGRRRERVAGRGPSAVIGVWARNCAVWTGVPRRSMRKSQRSAGHSRFASDCKPFRGSAR